MLSGLDATPRNALVGVSQPAFQRPERGAGFGAPPGNISVRVGGLSQVEGDYHHSVRAKPPSGCSPRDGLGADLSPKFAPRPEGREHVFGKAVDDQLEADLALIPARDPRPCGRGIGPALRVRDNLDNGLSPRVGQYLPPGGKSQVRWPERDQLGAHMEVKRDPPAQGREHVQGRGGALGTDLLPRSQMHHSSRAHVGEHANQLGANFEPLRTPPPQGRSHVVAGANAERQLGADLLPRRDPPPCGLHVVQRPDPCHLGTGLLPRQAPPPAGRVHLPGHAPNGHLTARGTLQPRAPAAGATISPRGGSQPLLQQAGSNLLSPAGLSLNERDHSYSSPLY